MEGSRVVKFTDLHVHTEYSLKDGKIRVADHDDPKGKPEEIVRHAISRGTGAVTATDHGNMYCHASLAMVAKAFDLKHIPGCEFYLAPRSRHDKNEARKADAYVHINAWAKNKEGYKNLCIMQKLAFTEGFYYEPRIDKDLIDKFGNGIMWSDACIGGTIGSFLLRGDTDGAYKEFLWFLNRFKDDFYVEYQNHGIPVEAQIMEIKEMWCDKHGVPMIATSDAHYYSIDDVDAHKTLLSIQYANWYDNPLFDGFPGDGYHLMNDDELLARFPLEYINNTQLVVDKVENGIIKFGDVTPPQFVVPDWFIKKIEVNA